MFYFMSLRDITDLKFLVTVKYVRMREERRNDRNGICRRVVQIEISLYN